MPYASGGQTFISCIIFYLWQYPAWYFCFVFFALGVFCFGLVFEIRSFTGTWSSPIWLGWLVRKAERSAHLQLLSVGITSLCRTQLLTRVERELSAHICKTSILVIEPSLQPLLQILSFLPCMVPHWLCAFGHMPDPL